MGGNSAPCNHSESQAEGGFIFFFSPQNILLKLFNFFIVHLQLSQFPPFALLCPAHPLLLQSVPTLLSVSTGPLHVFLD